MKLEPNGKAKYIFRIIGVLCLVFLAIYLSGLITQIVQMLIIKNIPKINFDPISCTSAAFDFKYSKFAWMIMGFFGVVLAVYFYSMRDSRGKMDSSLQKDSSMSFEYSGKDNYGSSHLMSEAEIRENFRVVKATPAGMDKTDGDVCFGFLNAKKKAIVAMPESDWKKGTDFNRNIAVCGPPGSNKSRGFVMNYCIGKMNKGESLMVVDTKGELYSMLYNYARSQGYEVKILNLVEQYASDGWDILGEVGDNPEMATELAATIIRNTGGEDVRDFWAIAEQNILLAVILLKSVGKVDISNLNPDRKQTMGDVYRYIATRKITIKEGASESMEADFMFVRDNFPEHPSLTPFYTFLERANTVGSQVLHGLATRLQLFQSRQLENVLSKPDIDFTRAGQTKCIYFLRFSDQTTTYSFITTLFFSIMSVKLVKYADSLPDHRLPIPVNLVLDEFCNIGSLPDFHTKIATFRSRMINIVMIYQNNDLLENTYPNTWSALLDCCDTYVVLGVGNSLGTSQYVSEMTGEATISVESSSIAIENGALKNTSSTGKRFVKMAGDVRKLDKRKMLVFLRSKNVAEIWKMDYTENPIYKANTESFGKPVSVIQHETAVETYNEDYNSYVFDDGERLKFKVAVDSLKKNNANNNIPESQNSTPENVPDTLQRPDNNPINTKKNKDRSKSTIHSGNSSQKAGRPFLPPKGM